LWADESLRENNARVEHRESILPEIRAMIGKMTRSEVIDRLEGTGLPFAPIGKPEELFDDPQMRVGGLEDVTLDSGELVRLPTIPLEMGGQRIGSPQKLPSPGRDSRAVLEELGYDASKMDALIGNGAVGESN